jgi:hypothetical protein
MANLILNGSTSGSVTLSSPAVSGTTTLTLPATSGTVITTGSTFAGTGPAFSAYRNGNQTSLSNNAFTKIQVNAEIFDTANCFDSTTNYRFTPNVAGYYQINGCVDIGGTNLSYAIPAIYKNGANIASGSFSAVAASEWQGVVSIVVYLNGSTDYIELYAYSSVTVGSATAAGNSATQTYISGFLARAA